MFIVLNWILLQTVLVNQLEASVLGTGSPKRFTPILTIASYYMAIYCGVDTQEVLKTHTQQ